jgi:uncharacterized membrane protein
MSWTNIAAMAAAAFMASLVECVEALTVVLAVGAVRGWRPALAGSAAALALLLLSVAVFGRSIAIVALPAVQFIIGVLLLLLGLRWLHKAILRSAGIVALRDEAAQYAAQSTLLRALAPPAARGWDAPAIGTAFKIVLLEGVEVVFIVLAVGANGRALWPAACGAVAALVAVIVLGACLHRPLRAIPENTLKFAVGIMLAAFGTFWVGEGLRIAWPGGDVSILALIAGYFLCARGLIAYRRRHR